jgi:hypothetical protein
MQAHKFRSIRTRSRRFAYLCNPATLAQLIFHQSPRFALKTVGIPTVSRPSALKIPQQSSCKAQASWLRFANVFTARK